MREPMTVLKENGIRLIVLLLLQAPWLEAAHSQQPASPALSIEISRQETIYHGKGDQTVAGYTVDRTLRDYIYALPTGFDTTLASLGPRDRWLDIGAGRGQAILDYFSPDYETYDPDARERLGRRAQVVAISIEDRRTPLWQKTAASLEANKLQYLINRRLGEYSLEDLGKFQVITDVVGGFSYTDNLSRFMEKVLGFLDIYGSFFTLLQDVRSEDGRNRPHYPNAPYLTEIAGADGSEVRVCSWLKSISCVEVTCEFTTGWVPPIESYRVLKVCNEISVPVLEPLHYIAGTPPERRFRLKSSSPTQTVQPAQAAQPAQPAQRVESGK
jgi:SAM-dependent methyltransferase